MLAIAGRGAALLLLGVGCLVTSDENDPNL